MNPRNIRHFLPASHCGNGVAAFAVAQLFGCRRRDSFHPATVSHNQTNRDTSATINTIKARYEELCQEYAARSRKQ
jgi:hypothetical protein